MSLFQAKARDDLLHSAYKKCVRFYKAAGVALKISLSFWEKWERDQGLVPSAAGPHPLEREVEPGFVPTPPQRLESEQVGPCREQAQMWAWASSVSQPAGTAR